MAAKLQEMVELLEELRPNQPAARKQQLAKALLGSCRGMIPRGNTSTRWIRQWRSKRTGTVR